MEPDRQVEIQLGHMCNNRCVFCVSGQRTGLGEARPLPLEPLLASVTAAREAGHRKITLLGGEPTLQPAFLEVVRHAVTLGFDEIVIFTNGVKTARPAFIDEVRATGGRFTWRISIQGATKDAHERTTKKRGSFDRILRSMEALQARGERITVNMCVVRSNCESVDRFPELLLPYGVTQLHLDMMRPLDAGERTEEELRQTIPRYSDMVEPLTRMVRGFPEGFDVNIGNLPYCIAPELAHVIHHDGEPTETIAVDGDRELSAPWDKYLVKRRDKIKPGSCRACVFDDTCSGVFETYARFHGTEELVPVTHDALVLIDPHRALLARQLRPLLATLADWAPPSPFEAACTFERGDAETHVVLEGPPEPLVLALGRSHLPGAAARFERFSVRVLSAPFDGNLALTALRALVAHLVARGERLLVPAGDDAFVVPARSVAARLERLRGAAPFGRLEWRDTRVADGGRRAEIALVASGGERATVWLAEEGRRATGGYRVDADRPSEPLVDGLRAVMHALAPSPNR